jgi:hypothetical protein
VDKGLILSQKIERYELKYFISEKEYHILRERLKYILKRDREEISLKNGGYFIRSLYFDSIDDDELFKKQSGDYKRTKYRIRIYDPNSNYAKFEIKRKENNQIHKESITITKESAKRIIDGEYQELLKYNSLALNKTYIVFQSGLYQPKVTVDYIRDAYFWDFLNVRITFDRWLRSSNSFDIFNPDLATIPVILEGKEILEIKYNTILPEYIRDLLQIDSFERVAISKYALSRRFLKLNSWEDN